MNALISQVKIREKIFLIRGRKVMLDMDLAELFGVQTKHLNRQVRRNILRFPKEFMFQLTKEERDELVPKWRQFKRAKHSYTLPLAFTEHGVAMLASVLNSKQAVKMSIIIVKTFIRLRQMLHRHREFAHKLSKIENKLEKHDADIQAIIQAIKQLFDPQKGKEKQIAGFATR